MIPLAGKFDRVMSHIGHKLMEKVMMIIIVFILADPKIMVGNSWARRRSEEKEKKKGTGDNDQG